MFRASLCSSSGGQLYIYSIWYRHTLPYSAPIKSGLQSALDRWTVWQHTEWEDTRCCKYTNVLLKMGTAMLETCWGSWSNIIIEYIKLCVKLVKIQVYKSFCWSVLTYNLYIHKLSFSSRFLQYYVTRLAGRAMLWLSLELKGAYSRKMRNLRRNS
jgi:hypothetical protein